MIGLGSAVQLASEDRANKERDERNRVSLVEMGYKVLVFWECELSVKPAVRNQPSAVNGEEKSGLDVAVETIRATLSN